MKTELSPYREGYVSGMKVALEMLSYCTSTKEAEESLKRMIYTLTNTEEITK